MSINLYLNLEDDVSTVVAKVKKLHSSSVVLVCPKRCFLFHDSINLRLLKKQLDLLHKEVFILTMDEKGQLYAKEAGFKLKFLTTRGRSSSLSDIKVTKKIDLLPETKSLSSATGPLIGAFKGITRIAKKFSHESKKTSVAQFSSQPKATVATRSPELVVADAEYPLQIKQAREFKIHRKKNQKLVTLLVATSLLIVLAVFFLVLPKAEITVYPKSEPVTRDMEISLGSQITAPDPNRLVLPAKQFSQTLEQKNSFQSQGKKEIGNKAAGTVKIYNLTGKPITLRASTTTLNLNNKTYYLNQDVVLLKSVTYQNAKTKEINENSLGPSYEITAAEGGEDYNLPAGMRIEITNQIFGSRPQLLYAKTDTSVTGGTSRFLSVISDQDLKDSQNSLTDAALTQVKTQLAQSGLVLTDQSYTVNVVGFQTDKPVGSESPSFEGDLKASISGLAFNQGQLFKLVADRISQTLPTGKSLASTPDNQITYKIKTVDFNNQTAALLVHFEGQAVDNVDVSGIAPSLVGKSKDEVNEILKSRPEIDKIDILLSPSWQQSFPWFTNKISVTLATP